MDLRVGERCRNDCPLTLIHLGWNFLEHFDIWHAINWPVKPQPKHVSASCSPVIFDVRIRCLLLWRPFESPFEPDVIDNVESVNDGTYEESFKHRKSFRKIYSAEFFWSTHKTRTCFCSTKTMKYRITTKFWFYAIFKC
jgi:hypothetical protein